MLRNAVGSPIYLKTTGPTQLAVADTELPEQGISAHPQGFGTPLGAVCNLMKPLEDAEIPKFAALGRNIIASMQDKS